MNKAIVKRQSKNKQLILEQLRKTPIIEIVCQKLNIGRASYYRWKKEDPQFAKDSDKALLDGSLLINDMAESQLLSAIKDKHMTAIIFWLKHHHPAYTTKVEIDAKLKMDKEILTAEQENLIKNALNLAGLLTVQKKGEIKNES